MSWLSKALYGTPSSSTSYIPAQKTWLEKLLKTYGEETMAGPEPYTGQTLAPMTEQQAQNLANLGTFTSAFTPVGTTDLYKTGQAALGQITSGQMGPQARTAQQSQALWNTGYRPEWERIRKEALSATENAAAGPGTYWGSARLGALGDTQQDWMQQYMPAYSQFMGQEENTRNQIAQQQVQNALAGVSAIPGYEAAPTNQALSALQGRTATYGLASEEQRQQQMQIADQVQRWATQHQITDPQDLEILMALIGQPMQKSVGASGNQMLSNAAGAGVGMAASQAIGALAGLI